MFLFGNNNNMKVFDFIICIRNVLSSYQGYMTVIPRVIVHKRRSIGHASDLISIIPPRHHPGLKMITFHTKLTEIKII